MDPDTVQMVGLVVNMIMLGISLFAMGVSCYDRNKSYKSNKSIGEKYGISEDQLSPSSTPMPLQHFCPSFVHNDHHHHHKHNKHNILEKRLVTETSTAFPLAGENNIEVVIDS